VNQAETLSDKLTLLLVGFVLTTILGGLLGALLQHRSWRYKWDTENSEKVISTSRELFQEISRLMDRRLYRVYQFYVWSKRGSEPELKASLENYRAALADCNDNINRHLAMLQIYFGQNIREKFDFEVGHKFVHVGELVEDYYRRSDKDDKALERSIENEISDLRGEVYNYNLILLGEIGKKTEHANQRAGLIEDLKNLL